MFARCSRWCAALRPVGHCNLCILAQPPGTHWPSAEFRSHLGTWPGASPSPAPVQPRPGVRAGRRAQTCCRRIGPAAQPTTRPVRPLVGGTPAHRRRRPWAYCQQEAGQQRATVTTAGVAAAALLRIVPRRPGPARRAISARRGTAALGDSGRRVGHQRRSAALRRAHICGKHVGTLYRKTHKMPASCCPYPAAWTLLWWRARVCRHHVEAGAAQPSSVRPPRAPG